MEYRFGLMGPTKRDDGWAAATVDEIDDFLARWSIEGWQVVSMSVSSHRYVTHAGIPYDLPVYNFVFGRDTIDD